eukprot:Unigene1205_Nuclearia_a/m.3852 Unigene1205_Nuclearia_a/g.3852  ORF Unigene1205_Nuclearia_a/g.3852 Unigene1205_Nuclearia_a/m.3852 type:complete len:113 (-) Unigene1205_Nuclearia_a:183-521(-)
MSDIENLKAYDPFADTGEGGPVEGGVVHIRLQQRNGRKTLTTVQGLNAYLDRAKIEKLIKIFKKDFCCNGTIVDHKEWGEVIQLQGDHRTRVGDMLVNEEVVKKEMVKIHGF